MGEERLKGLTFIVLISMAYIGMCGPKGYGFSAVLVINTVWSLYSSLDMGMSLRRS